MYRVLSLVLWLRSVLVVAAALSCLSARSFGQEEVPSVQKLASDLLEGSREQRREAAYRLSQMGPAAAPALDALVRALDDRDRQVWFYSIDAIANMGEAAAAAVPKLIHDLGTRDRQRWYRTAFALGRIGEPAFEQVVEALDDENEWRRAGAALALSFNPELARRARTELAEHLGDGSEFVRHQVVLAMGAAGESAVPLVLQALRSDDSVRVQTALEVVARLRPQQRDVVREVQRLAQTDDPAVRTQALSALAELRPTLNETIERLVLEALQDENNEVRFAAMDVVLAYGEDAAPLVPALASLTTQVKGERRAELAALFERLGPTAATAAQQLVLAYLQSSEMGARAALSQTIAALGPAAADAVRSVVEEQGDSAADAVQLLAPLGEAGARTLVELASSAPARVRVTALRNLAELEELPREAAEALMTAMRDKDPAVRAAALVAVAKQAERLDLDRNRVVQIAEGAARASEPDLQPAGVYALLRLAKVENAVAAARNVLQTGTPAAKRAALSAIADRSELSADLVPQVATLLREAEDPELLASALRILAAQPAEQLRPAAAEIARIASEAPNAQVRQQAGALAVKLARAGGYSAEQKLRLAASLARDREVAIRAEAARLLATIGPRKPAQKLLLDLMRDEAEAVRVEAVRACPKVYRGAEAARVLAKALEQEPEWTARREIFRTLGEMGADAVDAVPVILRRLRVRDDTADALRAIRQIRRAPKEAEPLLIQMLRSRDRRLQVTAAVLLGTYDPPPTDKSLIPRLQRILDQLPDLPQLKQAVQRTIRRIEAASRQ